MDCSTWGEITDQESGTMKTKVLALLVTTMLLVLWGGTVQAGGKSPAYGKKGMAYTCDDCTPACLENPYRKDCPSICRTSECQTCDVCPPRCKQHPGAANCPDMCREIACQSCSDCSPECKTGNAPDTCPDICKDMRCYTCDDCSLACIEDPSGIDCPPAGICGDLQCNICDKFPKNCPASCADNPNDPKKCPPQCQEVPVECLLPPVAAITCDDCPIECVDNPSLCPRECQKLNCHPPKPPVVIKGDLPIRYIGDLGYYKQTDPADYIFGRVGVEYKPFKDSPYENISFLGMVGASIKVGGTDGDSALLLDLLAQYNWVAGSVNGWVGLGLGGWITSGDVKDDSGDTDLDVIANVGARVYGDPDDFNISLFLEIRSAVDEFDSIAEYGRFGAGLRFQM
jgi:hypothetical protein